MYVYYIYICIYIIYIYVYILYIYVYILYLCIIMLFFVVQYFTFHSKCFVKVHYSLFEQGNANLCLGTIP